MTKRRSRAKWLQTACLVLALLSSGGCRRKPEPVSGSLHEAVRRGDAVEVHRLIAGGANVSEIDERGHTPLYVVAGPGGGSVEVAEVLIAAGADVNTQCRALHGGAETALHRAVESGHGDLLALLIDQGADVNAPGVGRETPLHGAARRGQADMVKLLLAHGAQVDGGSPQTETPLHIAAARGHEDVVRLLLAAGMASDARDGQSLTPLHYAADHGQIGVVKILVAHGDDVDAAATGTWAEGHTPLYEAARHGHRDVVDFLLSQGARIDVAKFGDSLLSSAVSHNLLNLAQRLIAEGVNVEEGGGNSGRPTLVARALTYGHIDIARLLIVHGADVSMRDMRGDSPLHVVARAGDLELAELLLARGVDVDEKDGGGNTPLHWAARRDNQVVAQRLIAYHADVNVGNWGATTPLHYAVAEGHREMALLLLANGADVNAQDKDGDTPLHTAATRGRKEIVEELLQRGAAAGLADAGGRTPVEEAKRYRHAEIVSLLERVPAQAATTAVTRNEHGKQTVPADAPAGSPSETNALRVEKVVLSEADRARRNVKSVVAGNSAFALDLYRQLASTKEGNLFFSPYSISTALAMTYAGARANTETQMAQVLHFPVEQEDLHPVFAHLEAAMAAVQKTGDIKLSVANALWPQQGQPFLPEYLSLAKRYYGVAITPVDYLTEKSRATAIKTINTWVEGRTENRIRDLLQPRHVNEATRLVLTNAIYFKGNWEHPFDPNDTQDAPFHVTPTRSVTVPMMTQTETLRYGELKDVEVLELAYRGGELSLLVVLPKAQDGLEQIEKTLSAGDLDQWRHSLREQKVIVFLPKFKTTFEAELKETLKAMGMVDAFTWPGANFAGFDGDSRWFVIGEVVHKAYVDVNEEGTEAAAATAVVMMMGGAPPKPPEFRADHPFLFLIQENRTGSILFLGRVTHPR